MNMHPKAFIFRECGPSPGLRPPSPRSERGEGQQRVGSREMHVTVIPSVERGTWVGGARNRRPAAPPAQVPRSTLGMTSIDSRERHGHLPFSPRRGEKVPKADEGSLSRRVNVLAALAIAILTLAL